MNKQYVEQKIKGYTIVESRISLESVIFAFLDGLSPETIAAECYPTLSLEQVYGVITYYLSNRSEIDGYLSQMKKDFQDFAETNSDPDFSKRMAERRRQMQATAS